MTVSTPPVSNAAELDFPAVWLRDNCHCSSRKDPQSGQRLFGILDLPEDLAVERVEHTVSSITVTFAPDGHRTELAEWLAARGDVPASDGRTEQDKRLWRASELESQLPVTQWDQYLANDSERMRTLRSVLDLGFAVVRGTPIVDATVLAVARTFGYVRATNYGELFDVRVEANPSNLAFTDREISPHTDNPYRDPVPTVQLLHCCSNAVEGGDSGLVDGFLAAATLRSEHPDAFAVLAGVPVPFAWSDANAALRAERPIIEVDPRGRVRGVRFNSRSMQPLQLPAVELSRFYEAYRCFAEVVARPELRLTLRLEPGDCLIFDNVRLLHARTAFADGHAGIRHLQGCYADLDGLASTIAILEARRAERQGR